MAEQQQRRARHAHRILKGGVAATASLALGAVALVGTGASSGAGSLKLSSPVKVGGAYEIAGESAVAINNFDYGVRLAVSTINKAGGIGGKPVQYVREPVSTITLGKAPGQFLNLVQQNPTVIVGLVGTAQFPVLQSDINQAKIPVLSLSPANTQALYGGPQSSQYLWFVPPSTSEDAQASVNYYVKSLKIKKVAIMGTNTSYGMTSGKDSTKQLATFGLKPVATKYHSTTATDLTSTILAVKSAGAKGILDWDYPNPLAVLLKQAPQNGLTVPTLSSGSASIVVNNKLATGSELKNLYTAPGGCAPGASGVAPSLATFTKSYEAAYKGTVPDALAAAAYDSVFVYKAAVQKANSATTAKVNAALSSLKVTSGVVCGTYQADAAHLLGHTVAFAKYTSSGTSKFLQSVTLPPLKKQ